MVLSTHLINTPLIYLQGRFLYEDKVMPTSVDYNLLMKQQKAYVEGRDAKQIASIVSAYFTYDVTTLICIVVTLSSLFLSLAPGELWFKIAIPIAFAIPPIIRTILTIRLSKALKNNQSKVIHLEKPYAKVVRTHQGGDVYFLKGLRINGMVDNKPVSYFEYPLKGSEKLFEEKAKKINASETYDLKIVNGTHCVDNFFVPTKRKKTPKASLNLSNEATGKTKRFKNEAIAVSKEDLTTFLELYSGYEELFLQGKDGKYRKVTISTYDVPEKRSITVDKLQVDDPVKTIDILSDNYLDEDGNFSLLSIMLDNDPSGFFIELDRLRK